MTSESVRIDAATANSRGRLRGFFTNLILRAAWAIGAALFRTLAV